MTEPRKIIAIDAEELSGQRYPYQEDIAAIEALRVAPGQRLAYVVDI